MNPEAKVIFLLFPIGNKSVTEFVFPKFISTLYKENGEATTWHLWDGEKNIKLGSILPDKYKSLEFFAIYPPDLIVKRIKTGEKPYEKLITTNKL